MEDMNITLAEEDPLKHVNISAFYEQMKDSYNIYHYTTYVTDAIRLMISILSVAADVSIIAVLTRNPKLKTYTNRYIIHYSIWHIVFMAFFPLFFALVDVFKLADDLPIIVFTTLWDINDISLAIIFLVGLALAYDWFLNVHSPKLVRCSSFFNKYGIYLVYLIAAIKFAFEYFTGMYTIVYVTYVVIALFVIVFNYLDYRYKNFESNYNHYGLIPSNIMIFFWLPVFLYDVLMTWSYGSVTLYSIFLFTMFLCDWFSYSTSIILLIMLSKMDANVEVGLLNLFKRRTKIDKDDVEALQERENEDNPSSVVPESNSVYI